jgi:hypothetical protein
MQRFVWDLHYTKPAKPEAQGPSEDGVWAPPGRYTVELTVDGRDYRQPLTVAADPRVKLSQAGFDREFELARKVATEQVQVSAALDRAATLLNALDDRLARGGAARRQIAAVMAKASNIAGTRPHAIPFPAVPPLRTDSLQALAADLDSLESAVDGADADPSPDALSSYTTVSRKLMATMAQWKRFDTVDVPELNARLKAAGEQPI